MAKHTFILTITLVFTFSILFATQITQRLASLSVTPTPTVEVAATMDYAPTNCGVLAESMAIAPNIPHAVGTWPIWIAMPSAGSGSKGVLFVPNQHYQTDSQLKGWWSTKVAWFIADSYQGEVHLRAFNVADNSPMYFVVGENELTDHATLNPEHPGGFAEGTGNWVFFPSNVWVSKAGCYRVEAEWDGGLWQQVIAVGNVEN